MEQASTILTIKDVADILRCSKAHVANAIRGKVPGVPQLTHLSMGRRKTGSPRVSRAVAGIQPDPLI